MPRRELWARLGALSIEERAKLLRLMIAHNAVATTYRLILNAGSNDASRDYVAPGDKVVAVCLSVGVAKEAVDAFRDAMPWFKTKSVRDIPESKLLFASVDVEGKLANSLLKDIRDEAAFHWSKSRLMEIVTPDDFILNSHALIAIVGVEGRLGDRRYPGGDVAQNALAWGSDKEDWKVAMEHVRDLQHAILKVFPAAIDGVLERCKATFD